MITAYTWLIKLLLAHLLTDFVLQPGSWVASRKQKHFLSPKLYVHGLLTGVVTLVFIGWQYWLTALIIAVTHTLIDGWKSYQKDSIGYFLLDQLMHIIVIGVCWYASFGQWVELRAIWEQLNVNTNFWIMVTAIVLLTTPAGILIGQMTRGWREKIANAESLANAGKWIGIVERLIVFLLVMVSQYAAISLLIAAKGIIRFNEKERPEVKTEYLVIGTLISIIIAMCTGMLVKLFLL